MEKAAMDGELKTLIYELTQGKEVAEQLKNHLNSLSSPETRQSLVEKILSSYNKALSLLNWQTKPEISILEPPHSYANSSPRSDVSDEDCHKDVYKKRKTQPRWTEQVKVCSGTGMEGPLDDGYNWRKYGQKDILGANFPRGYYRCTHRHSQGCLAIKQVQRSDQDPTIFEVTYRGRHTCFQATRLASLINNKSSKRKKDISACHEEENKQAKPLKKELSFNYREGIKSEDLDSFPPFSFLQVNENDIFKEPMMENDFLSSFPQNDFLGGFSPAFLSPGTSESNYFQVTSFGIDHNNVRTPESDSTQNSVPNSPIGDWNISIENVDFDNNFPPELFA